MHCSLKSCSRRPLLPLRIDLSHCRTRRRGRSSLPPRCSRLAQNGRLHRCGSQRSHPARGEHQPELVNLAIVAALADLLIDGLKDLVQARELDWELSDSPAGLEELLRWETNSFGPGGRSQLVLGADIVIVFAGYWFLANLAPCRSTTRSLPRNSLPLSPSCSDLRHPPAAILAPTSPGQFETRVPGLDFSIVAVRPRFPSFPASELTMTQETGGCE